MKALILVGGFGTRLRPLTISLPKPLIPFCGRPMVEWQIASLVKIGVKKIILAIGYKEQLMQNFMIEMREKYNIDIVCSVEKEPLNTGGPIKLAQKLLIDDEEQLNLETKNEKNIFFVLNSDVICQYPLEEMLAFHLTHTGKATILVTEVEDPSRFGIVVHDIETKKVSQFVEKPTVYMGNHINAGMYIFDLSILNDIELKNVSLEKEIFPKLVENGLIYAHPLQGFWKDIGLPQDFLKATSILLNHLKEENQEIDDFRIIENYQNFIGVNLVHKDVEIDSTALIGPHSVIHKGVKIKAGCRVRHSVLMDSTSLGLSVHVFDSILMQNIQVGSYVRIDQQSIIAEGVIIEDDNSVSREKINPGEILKLNQQYGFNQRKTNF